MAGVGSVGWILFIKDLLKDGKANNDMMMDENSRSWYVLYTAPRLERKLMQHLTVAGYKTYCPMQTIYVNWNGKTKEIIVPFFLRLCFL